MPPVGMAATPLKVLTMGATGVVDWIEVVMVEGVTGAGVVLGTTGAGVEDVQSFHALLLTGTGAGATGAELVQSPQVVVSETGATGVEVVGTTGTTGVVQSTQEEVVSETGAGATGVAEVVQSCH